MLAQAPGAEDITERRKERHQLPEGFPDRRGDSGLRRIDTTVSEVIYIKVKK